MQGPSGSLGHFPGVGDIVGLWDILMKGKPVDMNMEAGVGKLVHLATCFCK